MAWLLTMAIWSLYGGLYAAAWAYAAEDLAKRFMTRRAATSGALQGGERPQEPRERP